MTSAGSNRRDMSDRPLKIYVAGPMTARGADVHDAPRIMWQNCEKGILAGIEIIRKGHNPYIPHVTWYLHLMFTPPFPKGYPYIWYEKDLQWLDACDALLYLAPSWGADREKEYAEKIGLRIFNSLDEIPVIVETQDHTEHVQ